MAVSVSHRVPMEHTQPAQVVSIASLPVLHATAAALALHAVALFFLVARIASLPARQAPSKTHPLIIVRLAIQLAFPALPHPPTAQPALLLLSLTQTRALPIAQPTTSISAAFAKPAPIACPAPV